MEISLNGTDVQMEVDTGASVSLISEETCITKVKDKLLTYPGNELPYWQDHEPLLDFFCCNNASVG